MTNEKLSDLKRRIDEALNGSGHDGEDIKVIVNAARVLSQLIERIPEEIDEKYSHSDFYNYAELKNELRAEIIDIITEEMK